MLVLMTAYTVQSQEKVSNKKITDTEIKSYQDIINSCFEKSSVHIDSIGNIIITTPLDVIKFNILSADFNFNGLNEEFPNRVRIFCFNCLCRIKNGDCDKFDARENFNCLNKKSALLAITTFRELKSRFQEASYKPTQDIINYINDNLKLSTFQIDTNKYIYLNTQENGIYKVNIKDADFGYAMDDSGNGYILKVNCPGGLKRYDTENKLLPPEPTFPGFSCISKEGASAIVDKLYELK